jgi:hypothetical protein
MWPCGVNSHPCSWSYSYLDKMLLADACLALSTEHIGRLVPASCFDKAKIAVHA